MARLRIAFVAQKLVRGDGQGRAGLELVRALAGAGHEVTVFSRSIDDDVAELVTFRRLRRLPGPQLVDDFDLLLRASLALRSARPDLTVVLGHTALPRSPYVYYAQFSHSGWRETWTAGSRPGWRHRLHARLTIPLEALVARRASGLLAPSATTAAEVPVPTGAARAVVPNGVDDRGEAVLDRVGARRAAEVPDEAFVVGFVGEYHTGRKGLDVILGALAAGPGDEHVVIAGSGDDRWLQAETSRLGLRGRVHALGFTSPDAVYAASDVVAVPSRYEPFSLVAAEGAMLGLPVVTTTAVGAAEHLGEGALTIDAPPQVADLRRALDDLRDGDRRASVGAEARRRAASLVWPVTSATAAAFIVGLGG